jgi:hypothetical protein
MIVVSYDYGDCECTGTGTFTMEASCIEEAHTRLVQVCEEALEKQGPGAQITLANIYGGGEKSILVRDIYYEHEITATLYTLYDWAYDNLVTLSAF